MTTIPYSDFQARLLRLGIKTECNGMPEISFLHPSKTHTWSVKYEARKLIHFLSVMIESLPVWSSMFVWKHSGSWYTQSEGLRLNDDIQTVLYRGVGITGQHSDILLFSKEEKVELVALVLNQLLFGWHIGDDICVVPDTCRWFLSTYHSIS